MFFIVLNKVYLKQYLSIKIVLFDRMAISVLKYDFYIFIIYLFV